jgi:hypothetical protein
MGSNFHTPYMDGVQHYNQTDMNAPFSTLDRAISYLKNLIVHCDGNIVYHPADGRLSWDAPLRFIFNRADGQACANVVNPGSIVLEDNKFAFVDLSEVNGDTIVVQEGLVTAGSASNFIAFNRVVLGYRNTVSNDFYPVALRQPWPNSVGS